MVALLSVQLKSIFESLNAPGEVQFLVDELQYLDLRQIVYLFVFRPYINRELDDVRSCQALDGWAVVEHLNILIDEYFVQKGDQLKHISAGVLCHLSGSELLDDFIFNQGEVPLVVFLECITLMRCRRVEEGVF